MYPGPGRVLPGSLKTGYRTGSLFDFYTHFPPLAFSISIDSTFPIAPYNPPSTFISLNLFHPIWAFRSKLPNSTTMAVDCVGVQTVEHLSRMFQLTAHDFNVSSDFIKQPAFSVKRTGHARFRRGPPPSSTDSTVDSPEKVQRRPSWCFRTRIWKGEPLGFTKRLPLLQEKVLPGFLTGFLPGGYTRVYTRFVIKWRPGHNTRVL